MKLQIWSKQTTVKVLADKSYEESFKKEGVLVFEGAKNEYESAQIIITPDSDVHSYSIELDHVQSDDRCYFIWKDSFTVYNQKYIPVVNVSPKAVDYGYESGLYPDALLPFAKAIEYGENKIKAGQNQAVFISLKIPKTQQAGTYSGRFILTVDGEKYFIPVKITVWDFEVCDEVHCQSDFVIGSNGLQRGENDYFPQMYRKYVESLIGFRLSPHRVMQFLNRPYNEGADFVREVRYYMQSGKPQLSTIMLPVYPHPVTGIDEKDYKKHVLALAQACIEDNFDYFERAAVYCGFIDEPHGNGPGAYEECNRVSKRYEDLKRETIEEFLNGGEQTEFRKKVAKSMDGVRNYVTTHFDERAKYIYNWCPGLHALKTPELRQKYKEQAQGGDVWWYQCGAHGDSVSYAIDHQLIDARVFMWMTWHYGFKGTLYWESVQYFKWEFCLESHTNHEISIDCYQEACRCAKDNGDGFLFYPGKPYGIFGPVESIRLHAIRDGYEEYEYLWYFEQLCKKAGKDARAILAPYMEKLFGDGILTLADADTFDEVRREVVKWIIELQQEQKTA